MTRKQLMLDLVKIEAKNLREFLTSEEKERLIFENLNPRSSENCIYGLISGSCWSQRADELITKCCTRVYETGPGLGSGKVNGKPYITGHRSGNYKYFSPIEMLIVSENKTNNKNLLNYIKGVTDRLKLS